MASHNQEAVLPVDVIQKIQSILTRRQGSISACLSTSWNIAWLSRADAVFDSRDFLVNGAVDTKRFCQYVEKTIQMQEVYGKIKSCKIFIDKTATWEFILKVILKVIELGAVKLKFETPFSVKLFPHQVFQSPSLVELSVIGCRIPWRANLVSLKSLSLGKVGIEDNHTISDILWKCPSIEKLAFSNCYFKMQIPNLVFPCLKFIILEDIVVGREFYDDILPKFPCLKGLIIRRCTEFSDPLLISSHTLETIHFTNRCTMRAMFYVPNVREMSIVGTQVPKLVFEGTMTKCDLDLSIRWSSVRDSRFRKLLRKLNGLMRHLSELQSIHSRVSLVLVPMKVKLELKGIRFPAVFGWHKPVVDILKIRVNSSVSIGIIDQLIRSFHLMSITFTATREKSGFHCSLFKQIIVKLIEDGSIPNANRYHLGYLTGVDIQVYNDTVGECHSMTWKVLEIIDVSVPPETEFRLKLQYGMKA